MPRNQDVLVQIQRIDALLASSGVRDHCLDCIRGPEGGCCQNCALLGTDGCTNKPLSCALWVCHRVERMFPEVAAELEREKDKWPRYISRGYRQVSLVAESQMAVAQV